MSKKIFITGTSSGFGKLTTITLAKHGYTVIAGMRDIRTKNKLVAEELSRLANVDVIEIDVTDDESVIEAIRQTISTHRRIDVLINNAGVVGFGLLEAYSLQRIRAMFEVNFYGGLRMYQAVLPFMRKLKSGVIINISSGASGHTIPFMIPYFASKFGVESITEGLQEELKQFGIENVTIQPGIYPTEMVNGSKAGLPADKLEIIEAYGEPANAQFTQLGAAFYSKLQDFNMDPQTVADGILEVINMSDGTRPLRYPLDAIAQGTDKEFIEARAQFRAKWWAAYND